jgi:ABC-type multidrug transport system fused ATPase/permease subunit
MASGQQASAVGILRRGFQLSPELVEGVWVTLLLGAVSTIGRIVVPVTVQQTIDRGLNAPGGPNVGLVWQMMTVATIAIVVTAVAAGAMNIRLFTSSERGLATLRIKAFRHVHDLPVLTQNTERRGALVSRVTSDVDQISLFLQFGGIISVISVGQIAIATVVMAIYSWQLTIVVWVCFSPLFLSLRYFQSRMTEAYTRVRRLVGEMLSAISEPVVGAAVVRAHAIEGRTQSRIDAAIERHRDAMTKAQALVAMTFSMGGLAAGLANAGVIVVGVLLGIDGQITMGKVLAFAFLVTLFVGPVALGTQVLTDAQNAIAGWRRVIGVLDTPADVIDPGDAGVVPQRGPVRVQFDRVSYAYPGGPLVLRDVSLVVEPRTRVAVVGETGSGKTTFAKLMTRLMDPTHGRVLLDGHNLRDIGFRSLRQRVVMVPQEGYLFDATLRENIAYGRPSAAEVEIADAAASLGLGDWIAGLPSGLATPVGQRGESLSSGERQLVALVRAYLADPDLLVLDEATSAVDPATEVRINLALERLLAGRTSVAIAHRLSTAEAADEVMVFDDGRLVQRGHHRDLAGVPGVYARLRASWVAQQRSD